MSKVRFGKRFKTSKGTWGAYKYVGGKRVSFVKGKGRKK